MLGAMAAPDARPLPLPREPGGGPYRVCLVCLGNICRSPMAEVVLRACLVAVGLDRRVLVDSAGTGEWHVGRPMNSRALATLSRRGYDGAAHRARQVTADWLPERELFLAMDSENLKDLDFLSRKAGVPASRVRLFGDVAGLHGADVPDPYGGNPADFARVLDMLERGMPVLVAQLADLAGGPA
jgi:protein-tyrosine phosphatase